MAKLKAQTILSVEAGRSLFNLRRPDCLRLRPGSAKIRYKPMLWQRVVRLSLWLLVAAPYAAKAADPPRLELRGGVVPRIHQTLVTISGVDSPFRKQALVFQGKFKFSDLTPGTYTVTVYHPQWGPTQKTIAVTPSFADKKGRVEVAFALEQSPENRERLLEDHNTVSVRELSISPQAEQLYREGRENLSRRKIDEAIARLEKAVELSPAFVDAWNELGTIYYQTGKYEMAEKHFRKALEHDPESYSPIVNLGGTLVSMGRFEDGLPFNLKAVGMRADDALANSQTGMNYFYLGNFADALKYLAKARTIDPAHFSQPQIFLAEIYGRMGVPQEALGELRDFVQRHPVSPRTPEVRHAIERVEQALK
jgi:Tfp pilus assembly protein PilF